MAVTAHPLLLFALLFLNRGIGMKKIYACLISICICVMLLCPIGQCIVSADSNATNSVVDIHDLVCLKKYLIGMRSSIKDADYNNDGAINALDLVVLKKLIFGLPVDLDSADKYSKYDKEGYYNKVVKS